MAEIWKPVIGFEGRYEVSSEGRVRSLAFRSNLGPKVMKPSINGSGYMVITLGKDRRQFRLHRLVLTAFVGECPEGMEGCHNDGNKLNNGISNLRWDTPSGNASDRRNYSGANNPNARLSEKEREEVIRRRLAGERSEALADEYGITTNRVYQLAREARQASEKGETHVS